MAEEEKKEMTQEEQMAEMQKQAEQYKKEWEAFIKKLEASPDEPCTNSDLLFFIQAIMSDMQGMAQLVGQNSHNLQAVMGIIRQISGAGGAPIGKKTQGGIILP